MTEKISGDYNRGYTAALIHVCNFFDGHSDALKLNKMYNSKDIHDILRFLLDNREELRETGNIADIIVKKNGKNKIIENKK